MYFVTATLLVIAALGIVGCACSQTTSGSSQSTASSSASSAATQVQVPNLVWLEEQAAQKHLVNSGLKLGEVVLDYSDTVPAGLVISQDPAALTQVASGSKVSITVSQGKKAPEQVKVPDLIGKTQVEAEKAISDAKLVAIQGNPVVTNDVKPGLVCTQSIKAGEEVDEGTQIMFATAIADDSTTVPDVTGLGKADAIKKLDDNALGHDVSSAYSDKVAADVVMTQSVDPGTKVTKGTVVTLQISLGPKPAEKVTVPNIYTFDLDDAIDALESAGLGYRYSGEENGNVIAMNPDAGTEVDPGTVVSFQLKHHSSTVAVPNLIGMTGEDALPMVQNLGLGLKYDESLGNEPIIAQDPDPGTMVDPGFVITATEDNPNPQPTEIQVPDLVGMKGTDALACCQDLGLTLKYEEDLIDEKVVSQTPDPQTVVDPGTDVVVTFESQNSKSDKVEVPNLVGMTGDDALAACKDLGLGLKYDESKGNLPLVDQKPKAGTKVDPGYVVEGIEPEDDPDAPSGSSQSGGSDQPDDPDQSDQAADSDEASDKSA